MKQEAVYAKVHGRVQGVGFRYAARGQALHRGLTGWVRNERDGTVELVVEGESVQVRGFKSWLQKGPLGAYVTDVEFRTIAVKGIYPSFTIEF